jgi:F-type H+-transporting ATP synthase subunit e
MRMLLQVLRWGALVFGVFYGFSHQSSIKSSDKKIAAQHEWDRKQKLIQQAKSEYVKKTKPATDDGGTYSIPYSK